MTQMTLPLSLSAQPRPRRRRPRRSALPGWRFALEIATLDGPVRVHKRTRTGSGLARMMMEYDAHNRSCRVVATRDQGRTWRPATAEQLLALQADARLCAQPSTTGAEVRP